MAKRATASSSEELRNTVGPASCETAAPRYVAAGHLTFTRTPGMICRPKLQSTDWRKLRFFSTNPSISKEEDDGND